MEISLLQTSLLFFIGTSAFSFVLAPILIKVLYKFQITRRSDYDFTLYGDRQIKVGTPIMGGLLVIIAITTITLIFNWNRKYTYVPMGVMGIAAVLGAADDLLNIFGEKRRIRTLKQTITLIKVHRHWYVRLWYIIIFPWEFFKHLTHMLGSHPGRGIQVHEKLLFQFLAGAVAAWWVYTKLDPHWHLLSVPFDGYLNAGLWIVPIIILFVMFTANAVNIADGLDGLAGGSLLITFIGLTVISWIEGRTAFAPLNATVAGALLAYTYFNIKPARFQMGDVGSLGLGALLAINMISIDKTLYIPIFGFIFYIEAIVVILQVFSRRLFGRRLFKMAPLHHHLEFKGWSEEKIVMRFWIIHALVVIIGIWMTLYKY